MAEANLVHKILSELLAGADDPVIEYLSSVISSEDHLPRNGQYIFDLIGDLLVSYDIASDEKAALALCGSIYRAICPNASAKPATAKPQETKGKPVEKTQAAAKGGKKGGTLKEQVQDVLRKDIKASLDDALVEYLATMIISNAEDGVDQHHLNSVLGQLLVSYGACSSPTQALTICATLSASLTPLFPSSSSSSSSKAKAGGKKKKNAKSGEQDGEGEGSGEVDENELSELEKALSQAGINLDAADLEEGGGENKEKENSDATRQPGRGAKPVTSDGGSVVAPPPEVEDVDGEDDYDTEPAVGASCQARWADDGKWYRAAVDAVMAQPNGGSTNYLVTFIDYGNQELLFRDEIKNVRISGLRGARADAFQIKLLDAPKKIEKYELAPKEYRDRGAEINQVEARLKISKKVKRLEEKKKSQWAEKRVWHGDQYKRKLLESMEIYMKHRTEKGPKSIGIEGFRMLTPDGNELLSDASLRIVHGRRYGLIGRNGVGKTTLLRMIATYAIPGFPKYLKVMHVEQEVAGNDQSVLEFVMSSDLELTALQEEERRLVNLLKEQGKSVPLAGQKKEAKSTSVMDVGNKTPEQQLTDLYEELQHLDAYGAAGRAGTILTGLQFSAEMQHMKTKDLSGGWRMRVALASALFVNPDLLLLDEPTNHLDFPAVLWLENYLQHYSNTLLVVSHDRQFLNNVITDVIHANNKKQLVFYRGDFQTFEKVQKSQYIEQKRLHDNYLAKRLKIEEFINTFYTEKKGASQNSKVGMVMSRQKLLEKMEVVEDPDEGESDGGRVSLNFPEPPPIRKEELIAMMDVAFGYPDKPLLFRGASLAVDMSSRIGILGANGVGKSTLIKLMTKDLEPVEGKIQHNSLLRLATFTQHHIDQLILGLTPVTQLMEAYPGENETESRKHLARFGIHADQANMQIGYLSGGQKSRLAFAMLAKKLPHLIILDEPTNHLDLETIDVLIEAVKNFKGAVIVVSHDQHFLEHAVDQFWAVHKQMVKVFKDFDKCKSWTYQNLKAQFAS